MIAWENEVHLSIAEAQGKGLQIIVPSLSIRAEPPVAIIDKVVDRRGTRKVAEAYLNFLYSARGQQLAAKHHFRPALPQEDCRRSAGAANAAETQGSGKLPVAG